jgi:predicted metal-dependent hydrolase
VAALVVVVPVEAGKFILCEGVRLFNDGSFFEAHDYFEEMWMRANSENRQFYQGLVQISVGYYHLVCKNYEGAVSQLTKGNEKLEHFPNNFANLDLLQFRQNINYTIKELSLFYSKKNYNLEVTKISFIEKNANKT